MNCHVSNTHDENRRNGLKYKSQDEEHHKDQKQKEQPSLWII